MDIEAQSYRLAKAVAAQKGVSVGKVVAEAIAAYYGTPQATETTQIGRSAAGFPTLTLGRPITPEDVAELEDE